MRDKKMKNVVYNPNKFNEGVNIFVSVNETIKNGVPIELGRSFQSCIARAWYFFKEEETAILEALEKGLPVTISGVEAGKKIASYMVEGYEIVDISETNPEKGISQRYAFKLGKRLFEGAPVWQGSIGMHAVAVKSHMNVEA